MRQFIIIGVTLGLVAACAGEVPTENVIHTTKSSAAPIIPSLNPDVKPTAIGERRPSPRPVLPPSPQASARPQAPHFEDKTSDLDVVENPFTDHGLVFKYWGNHVYLTASGNVKDQNGETLRDGTLAIYSKIKPEFCVVTSLVGGSYSVADIPAGLPVTVVINASGYVPFVGTTTFMPGTVSSGARAYKNVVGLTIGSATPAPIPVEAEVTKPWPDEWDKRSAWSAGM